MMKLFKRLLAGVSALALCAGMTVSGFAGIPACAVDDNNDDWIHAVGSRLYDKDGNEVWITGANWFGFNCGERFPHGLWSADVDAMISTIADHGINCLRLPIATELLMDWMNGVDDSEKVAGGINPKNTPDYSFNPELCRPDGSGMGSLEVFEVIMAKCKKYGVKVLVDVHSPALHNSGHNYNVWYYNSKAGDCDNMAVTEDGTQVTTEMWQDSLVWLADRYKNDDTLIAYDLKNEPHGKGQEGTAAAKWDGSTDENNWAYASTQCALAMLEKNPNALILIEGVEQYPKEGHTWGEPDSLTNPPYYPGWWGGQFRGVREYPIDLGKYQSQLVYSPHDYGPGVYNQTWFQKDFTTQSLLDDYWYDTWAFINAEDIAPLLIGEWGGFMDGAENQKWMTLLRDYMIDNHINHTFWCINPNSGDTGGLLGYDWATWDDEKYALFEPSLWQTSETGKYISLDHEHKLGSSGLTTAEYYKSYADSEGSNLDAGGKTDPIPTESNPPEETTESKPEPSTSDVPDTSDDSTEPGNTEILWGDANVDGSVDISDVVLMNRVYVGIDEITDKGLTNADVDQSGKIELSDSMNILKLLVHLLSESDFPISQ
ncbi:MAG: cellulase family glycosylhydrolase [Oscillospiraceae bacterium]|nr:cellulase family glycosylhydrolase [Oscillospiraceae bacterium]